jgi:hypothetical protein
MSLIDKKISERLKTLVENNIAEQLVNMATSPDRFDTSDELMQYTSEGASVRIGQVAAESLKIKPGTFLIWDADSTKVTLFDMRSQAKTAVAVESFLRQYRHIKRVVNEETEPDKGTEPEFNLAIDKDSVDRTSLLAGMERSGHTVTSLANAVGVDPPAISRILRKPRKGGSDPGGRNPSLGLAAKVCGELKVPVTKAFSDIFGGQGEEFKPKNVKGNSQSGQNKGLKKENGG